MSISPELKKNRVNTLATAFSNWNEFCRIFSAHYFIGKIGKGEGGQVTAWQIAQCRLAMKFSSHKVPFVGLARNIDELLLAKLEPTIHQFITNHIEPMCPHFVSLFAFSIGPIGLSKEARPTRRYNADASTCIVMSRCEEDIKTTLDRLTEEKNVPAILSLIAQTFVAIATLASIGVSHNDLFLNNILVKTEGVPDIICYNHSSRTSGVNLRTHGNLVQICDFGISSHEDWLNDRVAPLFCDPRSQDSSLAEYYKSETLPVIHADIDSFILLLNHDQKICHPIQFARLNGIQRDLGAFISITRSRFDHVETRRSVVSSKVVHFLDTARSLFKIGVSIGTPTSLFKCALELVLLTGASPKNTDFPSLRCELPSDRRAAELRTECANQLRSTMLELDKFHVSNKLL